MRPFNSPNRTLGECANFLGVQSNDNEKIISGICSDSRTIESGDLFFALPGERHHGVDFAPGAEKLGCAAIVTDPSGAQILSDKATTFPILVVKDPRLILGSFTSWFYGNPSSQMKTLGVTGTNGKTTSTYLLFQLLRKSGLESGLIGTIANLIGDEAIPTSHTTPEADVLQRLLATMHERHCAAVAMEVSSHALSLHRVKGTHFSAAAFTNLSQDHLDFHGTMENYYQAKKSLFTSDYTERALVTIDDEYGARLFDEIKVPAISISLSNRKATWHYTQVEQNSDGYNVSIRGEDGILIEGELPLLGEHNLQNAITALALAVEAGVDPLALGRELENLKAAPGRLERIDRGQDFIAFVDYAHTPDAVSRVLATVRALSKGRVIAVLGCGGDRDASKRPLMGQALLSGSDIAIFTSDNPRSENPTSILADMTRGLSLGSDSRVIENRRDAIKEAVTCADQGDVVIVLGKGHESGQEIAGIKHPFSDQEVLAQVIKK